MNATMEKFGYPDSLIQEYTHWVILLRPQQATLGALVLACKDQADSFSRISQEAFSELKDVTSVIERHLKACFSYDKINYLMLMMVDPDVHFHVLPRYANPRMFADRQYTDPGWPGPPNLSQINITSEAQDRAIRDFLQGHFSHP